MYSGNTLSGREGRRHLNRTTADSGVHDQAPNAGNHSMTAASGPVSASDRRVMLEDKLESWLPSAQQANGFCNPLYPGAENTHPGADTDAAAATAIVQQNEAQSERTALSTFSSGLQMPDRNMTSQTSENVGYRPRSRSEGVINGNRPHLGTRLNSDQGNALTTNTPMLTNASTLEDPMLTVPRGIGNHQGEYVLSQEALQFAMTLARALPTPESSLEPSPEATTDSAAALNASSATLPTTARPSGVGPDGQPELYRSPIHGFERLGGPPQQLSEVDTARNLTAARVAASRGILDCPGATPMDEVTTVFDSPTYGCRRAPSGNVGQRKRLGFKQRIKNIFHFKSGFNSKEPGERLYVVDTLEDSTTGTDGSNNEDQPAEPGIQADRYLATETDQAGGQISTAVTGSKTYFAGARKWYRTKKDEWEAKRQAKIVRKAQKAEMRRILEDRGRQGDGFSWGPIRPAELPMGRIDESTARIVPSEPPTYEVAVPAARTGPIIVQSAAPVIQTGATSPFSLSNIPRAMLPTP